MALITPSLSFAQGISCSPITSGNFAICCAEYPDARRETDCQRFYNDNQDMMCSGPLVIGTPNHAVCCLANMNPNCPTQGSVGSDTLLSGGQLPGAGNSTSYVDPGTIDVPVAKDCAEVIGPNGKITSFLGILLWVRCVISIYILPLIFSVGFAVFLSGVIKYVIAADSKEKEEGKKFLMWGITGLFVMVSVWGIVSLVSNTLGLENTVPQLQQNVYCAGGKKWDPVTQACK